MFIPPAEQGVIYGECGECDQADDYRQQRAGGRSQSHGEQGRGEEPRGQVNARHTHQRNGRNIMQEGQTEFSAGAEIAAEAEMNSGKNAVKNVPAEILPPKRTTSAPFAVLESVNRATIGSAMN